MSLKLSKLTALTSNWLRQGFPRNRWKQSSLSCYDDYTKHPTTRTLYEDQRICRAFTQFHADNSSLASFDLTSTSTQYQDPLESNIYTDLMQENEESWDKREEEKDELLYGSSTTILANILIGNLALLDLARLAISTLKRRKMKMNKHKLSKRRKLLRAKRDSRK